MSYLAIVKKAEEELKHDNTPEAQEVREKANSIQAVKITSTVLNDDIWLILDREFIPHDGLACYYAEEIPLLKNKTPEDIKQIHKIKLAFPGCRVMQEGAEVESATDSEGLQGAAGSRQRSKVSISRN